MPQSSEHEQAHTVGSIRFGCKNDNMLGMILSNDNTIDEQVGV